MKMKYLFVLALSLVSASAFAHHPVRTCAVVFTGQYTSGDVGVISDGEAILDLNQVGRSHFSNWDNNISSLAIEPGCMLTGWQYQNFDINYNHGNRMGGFVATFVNNGHYRARAIDLNYSYANKRISSLSCTCRN